VTAHALGAYDARLTGGCVEDNGLMTTIVARYFATATTHTLFLIDLGIDNRAAIEFAGRYEHLYSFAN
jgi:hypothetical protein